MSGSALVSIITNKYYQKRILEHPDDIPSPNEIATIALISEVVVMDLA
jgi:hypothetical protein